MLLWLSGQVSLEMITPLSSFSAETMLSAELSLHVRPRASASVLYAWATRTSRVRAVRTRGAGQLVRHRTYAAVRVYAVRVPASGVP